MKLKKVEKDILFERLTRLAGRALDEYQQSTSYTWTEIAEDTRITGSRFSEIRFPENYNNKLIGEKDLYKLIRSGILKIDRIKSDLSLTEKEAAYIESLRNLEDIEYNDITNEIIDLGGDPKEILKREAIRLRKLNRGRILKK